MSYFGTYTVEVVRDEFLTFKQNDSQKSEKILKIFTQSSEKKNSKIYLKITKYFSYC